MKLLANLQLRIEEDDEKSRIIVTRTFEDGRPPKTAAFDSPTFVKDNKVSKACALRCFIGNFAYLLRRRVWPTFTEDIETVSGSHGVKWLRAQNPDGTTKYCEPED